MPHNKILKLQYISRPAARFCLGVERFCRELVSDFSGDIVVAYSGGADSKCLLFALHLLSQRMGLTLHAATLDHMLRPESSTESADAGALCEYLGIRFHSCQRNVKDLAEQYKLGLEEAGRIARHTFFEEIRKRTGSGWIAVGHQLNDLAEDTVMRSIRGTGWPALGGMAATVPERKIIRPLLLTPRASVESFLTELGETWVNDSMNEDDAYFRNRVRKTILPLYMEENPNFLDAVAERWRMARDDQMLFATLLDPAVSETQKDGTFLARNVLESLPRALRIRKYMLVLASMGKGQATASHLRKLDASWERNQGGTIIQFAGNKRAVIQRGGILFF